jgi:thiol-disulfide isomerase/thioredoxin
MTKNSIKIIKYGLFFFLSFIGLATQAQHTITGNFPYLAGQKVRLVGFNGMGVYGIDSAKVSENGIFKLSYTDKDRGMGYLSAEDKKAYIIVLANEDIQLKGEVLSVPETIDILEGKENKLFLKYASEHPKREQALSAWDYLQKMYQADALFSVNKKTKKSIEKEKQRIKKEDAEFLSKLDPNSYISWYLPTRKLVSSVSTVAQYRTEEIPQTLAALRKLDYTDERIYKSGLLKDAIESHYWLLENMGKSLDTVFLEMNISTDYLLANLAKNTEKFNEITKYLFNLLEKHSLFKASEYLSLKVLTQNSCTLNEDVANQMELYRAMKIGNIAPDIVFEGDVYKNGASLKNLTRLSEIDAPYKVVIFGASWCPTCVEEFSQIPKLYEKWKSKGIEVVFVSLDTDQATFKGFSSGLPCISSCDYKKWNTVAAKDYHVFGTPTLFILDKSQKILLRPTSIKQIDAWVDYSIKK